MTARFLTEAEAKRRIRKAVKKNQSYRNPHPAELSLMLRNKLRRRRRRK